MNIRQLAEVGLADTALVGGKGASLGELTRLGLAVPPGFVVTTAFQDKAVDEHVGAAYRELGGGPVAVRSSATGEDSASTSFAGVQDTFLWVQGEHDVVASVRRCWASLHSAESIAYRRHHGVPDEGLAMAVVVQRMVDARCAGVLFTRSPLTGDRSVVAIEGTWGLGSALVGGEVTPDRFVVNKVTGEITQRTVASKHRWHRKTGAEAVPDELRDVACLTDDELGELLAVARRIEEHYGTPQDIEWAFGDDGLAILQSRPETVWARRDGTPIATPKARAYDHVFDVLGRTC